MTDDNLDPNGVFAGLPGTSTTVATATASTTPCNGGSFPQYNSDCAVGYVDSGGHFHAGYPPGYTPQILGAMPSLDGMHWSVFEVYYLDHIPAGMYLPSWSFKPFTGANPIETRSMCGVDFAGKKVHRVPGIKEVNMVYFYRVGAGPNTNPGFENGFNKAYLSTHQYAHAAMNSFMSVHPINGLHALPF